MNKGTITQTHPSSKGNNAMTVKTSTQAMTPVVPGTPRWEELVTMGIIKDSDRNWFLGDAALEIAPKGENGVNNGQLANLALYAASIGVDFESLKSYRTVAASWPGGNRIPAASWRVHQFLMSEEDRPKLIAEAAKLPEGKRVTVTRAHELKGYSTEGRPAVRAVAKTAKDVKALLTDPVVRSIFEEQPDLIAALPEDVVKAFIESQGADEEQEALVAELRKNLAAAQAEAEELRKKLTTDPEAIAQERDEAKLRVREAEAALKEALIEQGKLKATTDGTSQKWATEWKANQDTIKRLQKEKDDQFKLARDRAKELAELKEADPDRLERMRLTIQYRKLDEALNDLAQRTSNVDRLLRITPLTIIGEHQKALIQLVDETIMHLYAIKANMGEELSASEAARYQNRKDI